ncbi:MAG: 1-deoxy-D-xylulose-5-phosphate synthase [Clostridia bacterium]|nr:1-deoxy-D-xylulose-5-phosphate synthase [Clostridia bacterium]
MILEKIHGPADVKKLTEDELTALCSEIRTVLIETVSKNGGHLASNLGVVELTAAIHYVFDSPDDQIVFDVGHQCYTHKLLTGRADRFSTLRQRGGLSGFCRPNESEHDVFYSGHSATSVSAGLGLAAAKKLSGDPHYVVSVIGDGSFTGGMVYEALNNGGRSGTKHIIILNDNKMSISENVGAFAKYLAVIRSTPQYYTFKASTERTLSRIPSVGKKLVKRLYQLKTDLKNKLYAESNFFEDLGYRYMGPIDGHEIPVLIDALRAAKAVRGPVVLHVITQKGRGYPFAEENPSGFHGVSGFSVDSGEAPQGCADFSAQFGALLCEKAAADDRLCAVTAAMGVSTGLGAFAARYPKRFFDVGIAEEHAVTFASGLAKNGMTPVFAVYSTFLQRCYDQLLHDVSLQGLKVIFAIDRAGFVGEDGETHQGLFDVSFLNTIPNLTVFSPASFAMLKDDLTLALKTAGAAAVRYPRGGEGKNVARLEKQDDTFYTYGDAEAPTMLVTYGRIADEAIAAVDTLNAEGRRVSLLALNRIKPLPEDAVTRMLCAKDVFFFEEGMRTGGVGEETALALTERGAAGRFHLTAVPQGFVPQASVQAQLQQYRLDADGMCEVIRESQQRTDV